MMRRPALNPAPPASKDNPARIHALRKVEPFKAQALAENWSAKRLSVEAKCSIQFACDCLRQWAEQRRVLLSAENEKTESRLVEVARSARERELRAHERLERLLERLERQLTLSDDIDAGELDKLVKIKRTYFQHVESVTGLDVVKQSAIRRMANDDKSPPVWDGITEIDVTVERIMPSDPESDVSDLF